MEGLVLELQSEILNSNCDILSILRKAHLMASKLNLNEFDEWIIKELNGYKNYNDIPEYREVTGVIKAHNPVHGLIEVLIPKSLSKDLNSMKLNFSISEIIELSRKNESIKMLLTAEISELLCSEIGITFPCYFIFGVHCLLDIIEKVKNTILQWCIDLGKAGIVGTNLKFNDNEIKKAKEVLQNNTYYISQVFNGDIKSSNFSFNNILNNYEKNPNLQTGDRKHILFNI